MILFTLESHSFKYVCFNDLNIYIIAALKKQNEKKDDHDMKDNDTNSYKKFLPKLHKKQTYQVNKFETDV